MKILSDTYVRKMRKYVGKAVIRTAPTSNGDFCFMEKIVFLDYISSRELSISWGNYGQRTFKLVSPYLDENWTPLEEILKYPHPEYGALEGKYVKRVVEDGMDPSYTRREFDSGKKYILLTATKSHLFIDCVDEKEQHTPFILHTSRKVACGWVLDPEFN